MPIKGANTMNIVTTSILVLSMLPKPAAATAAPAKPPISVCEEEEGMPYHQVRRFQKIAAIKPESTITIPFDPFTTAGFTVLATVFATA